MSITIRDLQAWKAEGRRFAMLTAYDYPTAKIFDEAGIPVLLVGDSVGNTILGYENTLPVTMEEMLHHTRAVARGVTNALVVGDMPFLSYQVSVEEGVRNAGRFLKEGGAGAVKIEGAQVELVHRLVDLGIPVMAHVGLTPQSVHAMGGYRVQGRGEEAARVTDIMTRYADLATIGPDAELEAALKLLQEREVNQLPVVTDEGRTVVGLLTRAGILRLIEARMRLGV